MYSPGSGSGAAQPKASQSLKQRKNNMQRVDAVIDLALNDPLIARDQKLHGKLQDAMRHVALRPDARIVRKILPKPYRRYRGTVFPLTQRNGRPVPPWRQLSPWMKMQIASLCLIEKGHVSFRVHLHEEVEARIDTSDPDALRRYFRDRIARCARKEFGVVPFFWFVIENRTKSGTSTTRPHIHGEIQIVAHANLPTTKHGSVLMKYRRIIAENGIEVAERIYGRERTRQVLLDATGNSESSNAVVGERNQRRNLWMRTPYFNFGNPDWVSYAFKNTRHASRRIGHRRLAISLELNREAQRLWRLIREGESAMEQWR